MNELTDERPSGAERPDLEAIKARAAAATEGPWEWDNPTIGQHWSRPEPWATVVDDEVNCGGYCYGGSSSPIRRPSTSRSGSVLARTITRGRGATCPRKAGVSVLCVSTQTRGHVRSVAPPGRSATTLTATPRTTSPGISPSCVAVATCEKTGA